jgi:hypothetical protein
MPIDKYESQIQHSLYGRKLGLDKEGFAVAVPGVRVPSEFSTAGSTLTNYGISVLSGSTDAWTLPAPQAIGIRKTIVNASTLSTATLSVVRSTANGACSFLHTTATGGIANGGTRINLLNVGSAVEMVSISTAVWAVTANVLSSLYYTASTSS